MTPGKRLVLAAFGAIACWVLQTEPGFADAFQDPPFTHPTAGSVHGPFSSGLEVEPPRHAYSPFDEPSTNPVSAPIPGRDFVTESVLIKLRPEVRTVNVSPSSTRPFGRVRLADQAELERLLEDQGIEELEPIFPETSSGLKKMGGRLSDDRGLARWYRAATHKPVMTVLKQIANEPAVEAVEPDYLRRLAGTPSGGSETAANDTRVAAGILNDSRALPPIVSATSSRQLNVRRLSDPTDGLPSVATDPLFSQQWHLSAARIPEAWSHLQALGLPPGGSRDIVVAVIDSGVDLDHPDLAANLWTNSREIAGNGVDDDGNGYVDDLHGLNAITRSGNPADDHGHGTHVAGIIASQANNHAGGVGVAFNVQIMPIKAAQYSGTLTSSDIARAVNYAVAQGADIINMSFGGYVRSQVEEDALAVAFAQCVLVAAAGNDDLANEEECEKGGRPMYPAAYNWVLGVMASDQTGRRASFSNRDCVRRNSIEYELAAPGVDVFSTLPSGGYAAWDGTSMATPIVSGLAALVRTKFPNKSIHSSRFVMGQIASNTNPGSDGTPGVDALKALSGTPQPELSYVEHWIFDTTAQSPINDGDGIVDAGETVELAIVLRNHWGQADQVTARLEAHAEGAFAPDPYVTWETDTVSYGAMGSFNTDDNGLIYDAEGAITGVRFPFRFRVATDCPNDHIIPFRLRLSCRNGLDPGDATEYSFVSRFTAIVQRGRELPRIVSQNMTLTKDYYWIIPDATLIESGVTVTVLPGTQVQFWSASTKDPYANTVRPYLQVEGTLNVEGTAEEPAELFQSGLLPLVLTEVFIPTGGLVNLRYARVRNANILDAQSVDHCYFDLDGDPVQGLYSARRGYWDGPALRAQRVHRSVFRQLDHYNYFRLLSPEHVECLFDNCNLTAGGISQLRGNAFLKNYRLVTSQFGDRSYRTSRFGEVGITQSDTQPPPTSVTRDNAFLNVWWDPDVSHWLRFYARDDRHTRHYLQDNYWGTTSRTLIDAAIVDYQDDFNKGQFVYEPILTEPPVACYPFVADVRIGAGGLENVSRVGAEPILIKVIFNRDMNQAVQPQVSFGPDIPYTDYSARKVEGGWIDPRTWMGSFTVTPVTGDGYQFVRVAGAVAADDPWLVSGDDSERFRFEIITSGTESMNLQAIGGEGKVSLNWSQDDFDLLGGYNLYRSANAQTGFSRLNTAIIPASQKSWVDTAVVPGRTYYYKFTVVKTDMSESDFSNVATGTPLDTIPPTVAHTPMSSAAPGLPLTFAADVTDNVSVQSVTLFFRAIGGATYASRAMIQTTGNRYSATLEGSQVTLTGLEYFLEASDGISTARLGRPDLPFQVRVDDRPVITSVSPVRGPSSGATPMVIAGANFRSGARVRFGSVPALAVSVDSANQISCTTPPHFPAQVDVTVENTDGGRGALLGGFAYDSDVASLAMPNTGGRPQSLVEVPLSAANVSGLAAVDVSIGFDSAVLLVRQVRTGSLTSGWSWQVNSATPGQVRLSLSAQNGPVEGSGVLAWIEFEVMGTAGSSCSLQIGEVLLNGGAITAQTENGFFLADTVYDITGAIRFWQGSRAVSGATVTVLGERAYRATTGGDGAYGVEGLPRGPYAATVEKGDSASDISAYDAALVLQHAVGLTSLTGHAAQAADVNRDGGINAMDAFYILQRSVGLIELPFPGAGAVWEFAPSQRTYADLSTSLAGQDFTGVLLGDVSGNWSAGADPAPTLRLMNRRLGLPLGSVVVGLDTVADPGTGRSDVLVRLESATPAVNGLDLRLSYSASAGSVQAVSTEPGTREAAMAANTSFAGSVRVGLASADPLETAAAVIKISLAGGGDLSVTCDTAMANEGALNTIIAASRLRIPATAALAGSLVSLPVELIASGDEHTVGFSLNFDSAVLTFQEAVVGADAAGGSLVINSNESSGGRLGLAIELPSGARFAAGHRTIALVSFKVASGAIEGWTAVRFTDQPVRRELSDVQGMALGVNTEVNGVALVGGYEADVAPRAGVNGLVTVSDWVQVGRFVAALDSAAEGAEFQRADCAPRLVEGQLAGGTGTLTVSDWVQAGRYAAGLDPATPMLGPTLFAGSGLSGGGSIASGLERLRLEIGRVTAAAGSEVLVPVIVRGSAWVAGLGLSLAYDAERLRFVTAELAPAVEGMTLLVNANFAEAGRAGFVVAGVGTGQWAIHSEPCVFLRFQTVPGNVGATALHISDRPILTEVVDHQGRPLPADLEGGEVLVGGTSTGLGEVGPSVAVTLDQGTMVLSWTAIGAAERVEWTDDLSNPSWRMIQENVVRKGPQAVVRVMPAATQRFYRVAFTENGPQSR